MNYKFSSSFLLSEPRRAAIINPKLLSLSRICNNLFVLLQKITNCFRFSIPVFEFRPGSIRSFDRYRTFREIQKIDSDVSMSLSKDHASDGSFTLAISESKTTSHTRIIGVIRPPQDIRTIVDKTAHFVAKNGPEFVKRIVAENSGNSKFDFLSSLSPYHAYYQHRLSEFRDRNQQHADSAAPELAAPPAPASDGGAGSPTPDPSAQFKTVQEAIETPEAEQYTVRIPEGITGEELDIVKLTAQFVARNGKSFLAGLTSREIKNSQFNFLKPGSVMFAFFTSLADAYSKVLMPL